MAAVLDKGIASKLRNSLQATPGVSREQVQAFGSLIEGLQKPGVTEGDAEKKLREWLAKAPKHAATVVRSAALGSSYMRALPSDSWILKAFGAAKK
jgi:hypothetical protein